MNTKSKGLGGLMPAEMEKSHDQWGRQISIALEQGDFERARRIVNQCEAERHSPAESILDLRLSETSLNLRVINGLEKLGISTVKDAVEVRCERIAAAPNLGSRSIDALWQAVIAEVIRRENTIYGHKNRA